MTCCAGSEARAGSYKNRAGKVIDSTGTFDGTVSLSDGETLKFSYKRYSISAGPGDDGMS